MNKKAEWKIEPGLVWFFLIIILIIATMIIGSWDCRKDSDCGTGEICTSDHKCLIAGNAEVTIIKNENKYTSAALILGISIIIAAIIIRREDFYLSHHVHKIRNKFKRKL